MKRIESKWLQYRTLVIPADAGKVQVKESKRAFYAGAQALLHEQMTAFASDAEPTDADLHIMSEMAEELKQFNEAVKAGAA